ncbi:hypothetical protein JW835_02690 [bacterium]|nr:hypothetical protein [bacterium]
MLVQKSREMSIVLIISAALVFCTWFLLDGERWIGPGVVVMSALPLLAAKIAKLKLKSLIPDLVFGSVDTGLLTIGAVIGATGFGVLGAVVGGVVADAITDGIAGFFEGSAAEWLRSKGFEESRTALGSACGKMAGCLLGSGWMLTLLTIAGVSLSQL